MIGDLINKMSGSLAIFSFIFIVGLDLFFMYQLTVDACDANVARGLSCSVFFEFIKYIFLMAVPSLLIVYDYIKLKKNLELYKTGNKEFTH